MEINQAAPKFQDASIAPMHTTEHIVNRTMVNLFGCGRAVSAHIERKKSKLDFVLPACPSEEEISHIEKKPANHHRIHHTRGSRGAIRPETSARPCLRNRESGARGRLR